MASLPQVETLIEEKRSTALEVAAPEPPFRVLWDDSHHYTQFLLRWNARPKVFSITKVFVDEMLRRRGLRAYGVRVIGKRRSKVNQLTTGITALEPRFGELELQVANEPAA